jgi:predicted transcriptional regulator of viral defense system
MRFLEFQEHFFDTNSISFQDIRNVFGVVNQSQLASWKKKGYLTAVKRGLYVLDTEKLDILLLANEANDSYISLEFALSYYEIIPEVTPSITSVSNSRTEDIENRFGNFSYSKIAPKLFCGFVLVESRLHKNRFIRIAEKEKALFDLVYFRKDLKSNFDFESLRLNVGKLNIRRMKKFIALVNAPQIKKRLDNFVRYLDAFI